jgi:hypothetical protein
MKNYHCRRSFNNRDNQRREHGQGRPRPRDNRRHGMLITLRKGSKNFLMPTFNLKGTGLLFTGLRSREIWDPRIHQLG